MVLDSILKLLIGCSRRKIETKLRSQWCRQTYPCQNPVRSQIPSNLHYLWDPSTILSPNHLNNISYSCRFSDLHHIESNFDVHVCRGLRRRWKSSSSGRVIVGVGMGWSYDYSYVRFVEGEVGAVAPKMAGCGSKGVLAVCNGWRGTDVGEMLNK